MQEYERIRTISNVMVRYHARQLSRRSALQLLASLGLSAGGAVSLMQGVAAGPSTSHGSILTQAEGTPETPLQEVAAPPATPQLGEQPDGAYVWRVLAGGMDMEALIEAMAFLPGEITINAGDSVYFEIHGFHTVTFLSGQEQPPLFLPEEALGTPAATPTGAQGRYIVNPAAGFPAGGGAYDGTTYINSGLPDPSAPPFTLTFTEPGTHEYLCLVHPMMMKARIIVQEQGAERPHDQEYYDQQAAEQMEQILEQGRSLIERYSQATPAATGNTGWEVTAGAGEEQAQVLRFLPDRLEIKAGDTVRWVSRAVSEPHTVTFLGGAEPPELVLVEPQPAGPPRLVFNPDVLQPAGSSSYNGEEYTNSGWLQEDAAEFPAGTEWPHTYELSFDTSGEFPYYCVLHGGPAGEGDSTLMGMAGTIVVS